MNLNKKYTTGQAVANEYSDSVVAKIADSYIGFSIGFISAEKNCNTIIPIEGVKILVSMESKSF